uniref:RING-type domain-containing protein n=1 Tax=Graphocephala atropunctata TaxID=36148 RepID=A0A1B6LUG4_9HEMI
METQKKIVTEGENGHCNEELIDLAIALSLADEEENLVLKELQEEEEEVLMAEACAQTQVEQDKAQNVWSEVDHREEIEIEIAMAVSRADFLESSDDDIYNEPALYNHQNFPSENESLVDMYKNYRVVPTFFSETEMWPLKAIREQQQELRNCTGGKDKVTEWKEGECESHRCLICLTNIATRFAVPCGHRLCCPACMPELVNKSHFYSVTTPSGQVVPTDRRLPIQCFTCRAIIGLIVVPIIV